MRVRSTADTATINWHSICHNYADAFVWLDEQGSIGVKTRRTELFNTETPMICGGMMRAGTADLAVAASNAVALDIINALTQPTVEGLEAEIARRAAIQLRTGHSVLFQSLSFQFGQAFLSSLRGMCSGMLCAS